MKNYIYAGIAFIVILFCGFQYLSYSTAKQIAHDKLTHEIEMSALKAEKFKDSLNEVKLNRRNDEVLELTRMGCKAYLRADGTYTVVKPDGTIITL